MPPKPEVPKLATGTVVPPNKEFMAILGDNPREHEIVSPLSTMKQAVMEAMNEFNGANTEQISLLREQNNLLKMLLEKDMNVDVHMSTASQAEATRRANRRAGRTLQPVGG